MSANPFRKSLALWLLAFAVMLGTVVFQRLTGPTHPARRTLDWQGQTFRLRLPRSQTNTDSALIRVPALGPETEASLRFRRYPLEEPWTRVPFRPQPDGTLLSELPAQPAAGKLEYQLELRQGATARIWPDPPIILRFKGPVATPLLIAHVLFMFLGVFWGIRTGLSAACQTERLKTQTWTTLLLLIVGGLVLGPMVQKAAFGAYWTGWPFGYDLTDNKTLIMALAWVGAVLVLCLWPRQARWAAGLAALVMLGVYLVPHSLRGSQFDYRQQTVVTGAS